MFRILFFLNKRLHGALSLSLRLSTTRAKWDNSPTELWKIY